MIDSCVWQDYYLIIKLNAERFKFHCHNQLESESITQFVIELKRLGLKCEFGVFLEEGLRDELECGLKKNPNSEEIVGRET